MSWSTPHSRLEEWSSKVSRWRSHPTEAASSLASAAPSRALENLWFDSSRNDQIDAYEFTRTAAGWQPTALTPSATQFPHSALAAIGSDFATTLWSAATTPRVFHEDIYLRRPDGAFALVGPGYAPAAADVELESPTELTFVGASRDLSHAEWGQQSRRRVAGCEGGLSHRPRGVLCEHLLGQGGPAQAAAFAVDDVAESVPGGGVPSQSRELPRGVERGRCDGDHPCPSAPTAGPAYLVSHGGEAFPDLEIVLQGEGITLILDGHTDIKHGVTSNTFRSVPDAPVASFELGLPEGAYSALGTDLPAKAKYSLCGQTLEMPTAITAQNGAVIHEVTKIAVTGCPKAKHKRKKSRHTGHTHSKGRK
jgi:hypothetical protein